MSISLKKLAVDLETEFEIHEERHQPFSKVNLRHVVSQKRFNFPLGFFPRGLLTRQSANLMEYPGDLYYIHSPIHRKYTMTMRIEAGLLPTRVPEGSASSTLPAPCPPSFCLFALRCRFFAVHWISRTRISPTRFMSFRGVVISNGYRNYDEVNI